MFNEAEFSSEIVHLYTSSGNIDLADIAVKLLVNKERITGKAIILDEYGNVLGLAKDLISNT